MKLNTVLPQMEAAQLVRRLTEEELAYLFKHALVQDTAYASLTHHERKRLHRLVAAALEHAYPDQLDEYAALLAQHLAEAGELTEAIAYARQAARRLLARYAYEAAMHQLEAALGWLKPDEVSEAHLELLEEAGDANSLFRKGERAIALYQEALALTRKLKDTDPLNSVRLLSKIAQTTMGVKWTVRMDFMQRANALGNEALAELEVELKAIGGPPRAEVVQALIALSMGHWRMLAVIDWDAAEKYALAAITMAEELADPELLAPALDAIAAVYDGRSRLREHLEIVLRRLAVTQSAGFDDLREKADALRGVGMARMFLGEYAQALPPLREAERIAEEIQAIQLHVTATGLQAQCLFRLDRWDEVLRLEENWRAQERRYSREQVGVT